MGNEIVNRVRKHLEASDIIAATHEIKGYSDLLDLKTANKLVNMAGRFALGRRTLLCEFIRHNERGDSRYLSELQRRQQELELASTFWTFCNFVADILMEQAIDELAQPEV